MQNDDLITLNNILTNTDSDDVSIEFTDNFIGNKHIKYTIKSILVDESDSRVDEWDGYLDRRITRRIICQLIKGDCYT